VRYRTVPGIDRYQYAVRPFPVFGPYGTSPGCLSWLYESPATPDLHLMAPEQPRTKVQYAGGPVHQFSLVPRIWSFLSMFGHTCDTTVLGEQKRVELISCRGYAFTVRSHFRSGLRTSSSSQSAEQCEECEECEECSIHAQNSLVLSILGYHIREVQILSAGEPTECSTKSYVCRYVWYVFCNHG
jgi:hypothetical protein